MGTGEKVGDLARARQDLVTIALDNTVVEAARVMRDKGVGCLVVLGDNRQFAGILSERDILCKVTALDHDANLVLVADVMTRDVMVCTPSTPAKLARDYMATHNFRHLPIVTDGRPIGMVSIRDLHARFKDLAPAREAGA